jgi:hypothetical protein
MLKAPTIYKGGSIVSALTRGGGGGGGQPKLLKIFTNFENFLHTGQLVKPKKGGGTKVQKRTVIGLQWYCIGSIDHLQ